MTTPRTVDDFGGIFADALPVQDSTTEQSATYGNRLHEDTAQMSRTTKKAWAKFSTTASAGPIAVTVTDGESHAGTSSGQLPTCTKNSTGNYTLTYPASFVDALGTTETLSFKYAFGDVVDNGATFAKVQCAVSGTTITVFISTTLGAATLSDLSGGVPIVVEIR